MRTPRAALLLAATALFLSSGCARPRAWTARIVLTLGGAAGRPVHGLDVTVALPTGAEVAHDASTGRLLAGALSRGGAAATATLDGRFVAHRTAPFVRILLASREPMGDGEVVAAAASVLSAVTPPIARFEVVRVVVSGPEGASVPGASVWVSAVELR